MPWTFAHPAIIIPLKKIFPEKIYFLGLIVGAMVPDFGYYFGFWSLSRLAHSWTGLLIVCIPIGLLLVWLLVTFRNFLAEPLPDPHRTAFLNLTKIETAINKISFTILLSTIFIGALSHFLWDSFTHASGFVVQRSEWLKSDVIQIGSLHIYGYNIAQHLSTCVGVIALVLIYHSWLKAHQLSFLIRDPKEVQRYTLLLFIFLAAVLFTYPIAYMHVKNFVGAKLVSAFVVDFAFVFSPIFLTLFLMSSVYYHFHKKFRDEKSIL